MPRHDIEDGYMVLPLGQYPRIYELDERSKADELAYKLHTKLLAFHAVEDYSPEDTP